MHDFPSEDEKQRIILLEKTLNTIAEIENQKMILPHRLPSHQLVLYYDYLSLKAK
jgi:hypothetical protein